MKLESTISKLLANKTVLYIVSIISALNIIGYLFYGNMTAVVYFIVLALLVSYFSKNMIIILLTPLVFVNLFVGSQQQIRNIEGMTNAESSDDSKKQKLSSSQSDDDNNTTTLSTASSSGEMEPLASESFKNKNNKNKLDYGATVKQSYEALNTMLGKEGMEALTNESKSLAEEQEKLANHIKDLKPIMQSIGPMVENMKGLMGGMSDMKGLMGGEGLGDMGAMMESLSSLTSSIPKQSAAV